MNIKNNILIGAISALLMLQSMSAGSEIRRFEAEQAIPDHTCAGYHFSEKAIPSVEAPKDKGGTWRIVRDVARGERVVWVDGAPLPPVWNSLFWKLTYHQLKHPLANG